MYLSIPDESAPTPIQSSNSPLDNLTGGFLSSVGSGIEDWTQPFERLSGEDRFGDDDLSQGILNKDDYEKLPYAVPGGWHPGITPVQAFIEASKYEQDQKSAAYSDAHPVKAFAGSMIGEALNPLWWIGAGELAESGPILGRIGGESFLGKLTEAGVAQGIQAAGITAVEQGANELTGHEADPSSIIKNFAAGMVLGGAAHGIHLALRPQVAAMQDIADSVESGKPLDAANKVFPKLPESATEEIPSETTVLETPPKTLYRSSQGGDIWTEDIERAKSYPGHLQAITVPADLAESLRTTAGSEASKAARAAGHQPTTTDFWLGDHPELTKAPTEAGPNTMPVGGHKPVIEAAEQAGKDQQTLAEEIAQKPVKPATGAASEKPSPAATEAATPQFPSGIQESYEADLADSNKMRAMADALKQALGCRLNG